jgi:Rrf2 family protein
MKHRSSSMQLTRAADYGVRVMVHLVAQPGGKRISLPGLAAATGAPESFLSKVLQALARARMIISQRGQTGGFEIAPRGQNASMREVIEAIDGPIRLNVCLNSGRSCPRRSTCPAHPVWAEAQQAMLHVLETASVRAMAVTAAEIASRQAVEVAAVEAPATPQDCAMEECTQEDCELLVG